MKLLKDFWIDWNTCSIEQGMNKYFWTLMIFGTILATIVVMLMVLIF